MGKRSPRTFILAAAAVTVAPGIVTRAGTALTWDSSPATAGAQGGGGTWQNGGTANWLNGAANVAWNNANVDTAIFSAPPSPVAPGVTINLSGTVVAEMVIFDALGYTLSGGAIRIGVGGRSEGITNNADATVNSNIILATGADGWSKDGAGTLTLGGNNSSTLGLFVKGGTVAFASGVSLPDIRLRGTSRLLYTGAGEDLVSSLSVGIVPTDVGTVDVANPAARLNLTRPVNGSGTLVKQGQGTLAFSYTNNASAVAISIDAGTLQIDNPKVLGAFPITVNGGTLLLRSDTIATFSAPVHSTAAGGTIRLDRLTLAGATSGANVLPSLEVNGNTTLASPIGVGLSVTTLTNTATLDLGNLPLTVTGNATVLAGGGTYLFGHNGSNAGVGRRGLWIAHSGTHSVTATFGGDADDADLLVGANFSAILTLDDAWRGGGGGATSTLAFSNTAQVTLAPGMHFNTLTADRTAVRPLDLVGSASGRSTLLLDPGFVADHSNGGATDDGLGQIRLRDVT